MKLLLSYDGYLYKCGGKYYMSEQNDVLLKRYLRIFGHINLALRTLEVMETDKFNNIPLEDNRIEVFEIPMFRGPKQYSKRFFQVRKSIRKAVNRSDAGIFRLPSTIGQVACDYFKKRNKPFAVEVVANPYEILSSTRNPIEKILFSIIDRSLKDSCKSAKGVSYVTKINLPERYPSSQNAYTDYYSSIELPEKFFTGPRKYPQKKNFQIIHVANYITPADTKGNLIVINAAHEILKRGYDISVKFVGERTVPNLFDDITKKLGIKENIEFVGRKTRNELRELMIQSDLLVFPSKSEGLPRVIIEANSLGLPCIASDVGGVKELLSDEVIFDMNDYKGIANKIADIITSAELYEKLSTENFERAKEYESHYLQSKRDSFYTKLANKVN